MTEANGAIRLAAMGLLYGKSIHALIIFSFALQVCALPIFAFARRQAHV
jgi:hypothetical protein